MPFEGSSIARWLSGRSLAELIAELERIRDPLQRFKLLLGLAGQLGVEPRSVALERALVAAREVQDPEAKSRALLLLHFELGQPLKTSALRESLEAALEIEGERERRKSFKLIGNQISRLQEAVLRRGWLDDVVTVVRAADLTPVDPASRYFLHGTARRRGRLLGDIASKLDEAEIPLYFDLALGLPDHAGRAFALAGLTPRLPKELQWEAYRKALDATRKVSHPGSRSLLIRQLGPGLPDEMLPDALGMVVDLRPPELQTRALAVLSPRLDPEQIQGALESVPKGFAVGSVRADSPSGSATTRSFVASDPVRSELIDWLESLSPDPEVEDLETIPETLPADEDFSLQPAATKVSEDARFVNTGFSSAEEPLISLDSDRPLRCDRWHYFWLEVGDLVPGAIEREPIVLPTNLLPQEAELRVVLFTNDEELELDSRTQVGALKIHGPGSPVEVIQPASIPTSLPPDEPILRRRLFFAVRTPETEGGYRLRCNIYYRQILVQARSVEVRVSDSDAVVLDALLTTLDYTLSRSLAPTLLEPMEEHSLSLMMNADGDGSHGLYFYGKEDFHRSVRFDGQQVQDFIGRSRKALRMASWGSEAEWNPDEKREYRYKESATFDFFFPDLHRLAVAGYRSYDVIANQLFGGPEEAERFAERMRAPGRLQLALRESARLMIPVALLYDHPLDTFLPVEQSHLCPEFKKAWSSSTPLEEQACFRGSCPSYGSSQIVCPSGFWGFRHSIGVPLTIGSDRLSPPTISGEMVFREFPDVTLAVSTDDEMQERLSHVAELRKLIPAGNLFYADTRESTLKRMKERNTHVVYFYCHGGVAPDGAPFIKVGPLSDPEIGRDTLRNEKIRWSGPRPVVFINGCHTTDLEPERAIDLVSGFIETAGASGVIGTDITIFEPLAVAFGEHFLRRFLLQKLSLGDSIRFARLKLLKEQLNPLGLVYIPFGLASLHLAEAR